jgi:hypothetical protein
MLYTPECQVYHDITGNLLAGFFVPAIVGFIGMLTMVIVLSCIGGCWWLVQRTQLYKDWRLRQAIKQRVQETDPASSSETGTETNSSSDSGDNKEDAVDADASAPLLAVVT